MYICICISICLCCKWQQHQLMKWIAACLSKPDANWINPCLKWFAIPSSTKRSSSCFPHDASYKCKSLDPTGTGYGWALRCFPRKLQGHPGPIGGPCHLAQLWLEGRWAHPARTYARLSQHASRRDIGKLLVILGIRMYESHSHFFIFFWKWRKFYWDSVGSSESAGDIGLLLVVTLFESDPCCLSHLILSRVLARSFNIEFSSQSR